MNERTMAQCMIFKTSNVVKTITVLTRNIHEDCLTRDRELALFMLISYSLIAASRTSHKSNGDDVRITLYRSSMEGVK